MGEEPTGTGLLLVPGWFSECILILDGRLKGESAVVSLLFLSDELCEERPAVLEDREGKAYRGESEV